MYGTYNISNITEKKEDNSDQQELMMWIVICSVVTIVGLGVATLKYIRDSRSSPKSKHKRHLKAEQEREAKEQLMVLAVKPQLVAKNSFHKSYKKKKKEHQLKIEVQAIVLNQPSQIVTEAIKPENKVRNFSLDVVPCDKYRLVLKDHDLTSDYYNASYIEGYSQRNKKFIACQGPRNKEEVIGFWQIVWQENVQCVVMAMGLFQHTSMVCSLYWEHPGRKNDSITFGPFSVMVESLEVTTYMKIRSLKLFKGDTGEGRELYHFELNSWTEGDDAVIDPAVYLKCNQIIRKFHSSGPLLVHCRCGGAKTAIYLAIDMCLNQLDTLGAVDIYSCVLYLRQFRTNMIRTLSQYRTVYEAVAFQISSGRTVLNIKELASMSSDLRSKSHVSDSFRKEFQMIKVLHGKKSAGGAVGHHIANRHKSRQVMMQPEDQHRPYLNSADNYDDTDYINAVYLDGFRSKNRYIITEWPNRRSINNFWRLIHDHYVSVVVMLNDTSTKFSKKWPRFWPNEKEFHDYGPININFENSTATQYFTVTTFSLSRISKIKLIKHKTTAHLIGSVLKTPTKSIENARTVKIYQVIGWDGKDVVPEKFNSLLYLYDAVEQWQMEDPRSPICVLSRDGYRRCGIFITIHISSMSLQEYGEVDIFNIVRIIKKRRYQLVTNEAEYSYCYKFLSYFARMVLRYAPTSVKNLPSDDLDAPNNLQVPLLSNGSCSGSDTSFLTAKSNDRSENISDSSEKIEMSLRPRSLLNCNGFSVPNGLDHSDVEHHPHIVESNNELDSYPISIQRPLIVPSIYVSHVNVT